VEGGASRRGGRVLRQHDGRGQGGERLLLHLGERGRGRELDPRRDGDSILPT
jgi:hypothetical protein